MTTSWSQVGEELSETARRKIDALYRVLDWADTWLRLSAVLACLTGLIGLVLAIYLEGTPWQMGACALAGLFAGYALSRLMGPGRWAEDRFTEIRIMLRDDPAMLPILERMAKENRFVDYYMKRLVPDPGD